MLIMLFLHTSVFVVGLAMVVVQLSEKLIEIILVRDPVVLWTQQILKRLYVTMCSNLHLQITF